MEYYKRRPFEDLSKDNPYEPEKYDDLLRGLVRLLGLRDITGVLLDVFRVTYVFCCNRIGEPTM